MATSGSSGFRRVVPFALVALVMFGFAAKGTFGSASLALAFVALVFTALSLGMYWRHPASVRGGLLIGLVLTAALIPQSLLFAYEATRSRDNAIAIAIAAVIGALALLPVAMMIASAAALRRLPSSIPAWLAAIAGLAAVAGMLFVLVRFGAGLEAPTALDGIEVHQLRFSQDGRELTAASEYARKDSVFSVADGRFLRAEETTEIRHLRSERPPYRSVDGSLALEIGYAQRGGQVDALTVRDAGGKVLWTHRLGLQDTLARGNACCLVGAAAFSPDSRHLAVAYFGTVYLYDARSGAEIGVMKGPTRERPSATFWWWNLLGRR
jgi:hypothetical protein